MTDKPFRKVAIAKVANCGLAEGSKTVEGYHTATILSPHVCSFCKVIKFVINAVIDALWFWLVAIVPCC